MPNRSDPKYTRAFAREMLRSVFVSLFWSVVTERRKSGGFTLKGLADDLGANKSEVTRWFRGSPNWTLNTIASLAETLEVDLIVEARDRRTGTIYTASGIAAPRGSRPDESIKTETVPPKTYVFNDDPTRTAA